MDPTLQPTSLDEALAARAARPDALAIAGGTDVMVELNRGRGRPPVILDLTRVPDLRTVERENGAVRLGAGVAYAAILDGLSKELPALALAARTVGSPQIRNRGTVGGNLGTASPAGDALPPLVAAGARVELRSVRGARTLPVSDFLVGPKRNALADDELIVAILIPARRGPQQFAKVGRRSAMAIASCSLALVLDPEGRHVGTGIGSAGPTTLRAVDAERFLEGVLAEAGAWESPASLPPAAVERFSTLVAAAARPIDDLRGLAAYRRHALAVLARRTLTWAWDGYRSETR